MEETKKYSGAKRGRKPIPEDQKKKTMWTVLSPELVALLTSDAENGKADTPNQMIMKIVRSYYKKRLSK